MKNGSASFVSSWPVINSAGVLLLLADMQIQGSWVKKNPDQREKIGSYFISEVFCLTTGDIYVL